MKKKPVALLLSIMFILSLFPMNVFALTYPALTESNLLAGTVYVTTEDGETVATNNAKKYILDGTSVISGGTQAIVIELHNTAPATINQIKSKGQVTIVGTGQLNVITDKDIAIDVTNLKIAGEKEVFVTAKGATIGVKTYNYGTVAQETSIKVESNLDAEGSEYGVYSSGAVTVDKGGSLVADAEAKAAVYAKTNVIALNSSRLTVLNTSAEKGVDTLGNIQASNSSEIFAVGRDYGAYTTGAAGVVIDQGSKFTVEGQAAGIQAQFGNVEVRRGSTLDATSPNTGIYAKNHVLASFSTIYAKGGVYGINSGGAVESFGADALIDGEGGEIGIRSSITDGDRFASIGAREGGKVEGRGTGENGRGIVSTEKGSSVKASGQGSLLIGDGKTYGIETQTYIVADDSATITAITSGLASGYTATKTRNNYANGKSTINEVYTDLGIILSDVPFAIDQEYDLYSSNPLSQYKPTLDAFTWTTPGGGIVLQDNGLVATKELKDVEIIGTYKPVRGGVDAHYRVESYATYNLIFGGSGTSIPGDSKVRTVIGYVFPLVTDDHGLGAEFLKKHDVVVELRPESPVIGGDELKTIVKADGKGEIGKFVLEDVPYGNYLLSIKRPGYLLRCMNVTISADLPMVVELTPPGAETEFNLWAGDVNGNFIIDNLDIMMVIESINLGIDASSPDYNPACDLNADGKIDDLDIQMVIKNLSKTILNYPGAEDIDLGVIMSARR